MKKIIALQGIPGSGKSTWAREFIVDNSESWVIISRDSIREMLGEYWVPSREELVLDIENDCILRAIDRNYNIIIDATNFNKSVLSKFKIIAETCDYEFEIKVFSIELDVAIQRDSKRLRPVGERIIRLFHDKYLTNGNS